MPVVRIGWSLKGDQHLAAYEAPMPLRVPRDPLPSKKGFLSCPAVRDFSSGFFQLTSPFSLRLRLVETEDGAEVIPVYPFTSLTEELVRQMVKIEPPESWRKRRVVVLQIPSPYVFFADERVEIEQSHPHLSNQSRLNWRVIPGRFDIYAWQRPLNWAVEWDATCGDFEIRTGEVIYNLRFLPHDYSIAKTEIELVRVEMNEAIESRLKLTAGVANVRRGTGQLFDHAAALRSERKFLEESKDASDPC